MRKQYVIVEAWVPDGVSEGAPEHPIVIPQPPLHPTHPIPPVVWPPVPGQPPVEIWPGPGYPAHPIAPGGPPPGIWGGAPIPVPTPPIYYPGGPVDPDYGVPGYRPSHPIAPGGRPPGFWGGAPVPVPTPPIYYPGGPVDPDYGVPGYRPSHPIAPGGRPPGIWGGAPIPVPTPPIYYPGGPVDPGYGVPGYRPSHPIAPGGPVPPVDPGYGYPISPVDPGYGVPGYTPEHPIYFPPVFNPDDLPEHPEVPDLNAGNWLIVVQDDTDKTKPPKAVWAFVPWPLAVTHPDYQPQYPPDSMKPGDWVVIVYGGAPANAWIPEKAVPPGQGGTPPGKPPETAPAKA